LPFPKPDAYSCGVADNKFFTWKDGFGRGYGGGKTLRGLRRDFCVTREEALAPMRAATSAADGFMKYGLYEMKNLNKLEKESLIERHLISPSLAENSYTGVVLLEYGEELTVMVNEEDHIRAQCIIRGLNLAQAYARVSEFDRRLERCMPIAFDQTLGYLTACPSNLGTGMRASVMLFLPALTENGKIGLLFKKLNSIDFTVRGVYGEGSGTAGALYQISNRRTLGLTEKEILAQVTYGAEDLCKIEHQERLRLNGASGEKTRRRICGSLDILLHRDRLSSVDFMNLIADVKLGVCLRILPFIPLRVLDELIIHAQPANLCQFAGRELPPDERDFARAEVCRMCLA
jgi:protein arginine kinase